MRVLLDTQILIWSLRTPDRLNADMRALINAADTVFFSAGSIWEIAIKAGLRRADFTIRPETVAQGAREAGFVHLPVDADVAAGVTDLPPHHRDPFDRLLVAQAIPEAAWLYTTVPMLALYSKFVRVVR